MTSLPSRWPSVEDGEMLRASSLVLAEQETCTLRAALQLLGLKHDSFYHLLAQGQIRKVPIGTGRSARYVMADLKAVARQRQVFAQATYSLDEAMHRLGMLDNAFLYHVKRGRIRRAAKDRYVKADVEALYEARRREQIVPDHLCTMVEAAKLLLRHKDGVLTYVRQGLLHPERGEKGQYYFSRDELLAFQERRLEAQREAPPDEAQYTILYAAAYTRGVRYLMHYGASFDDAEEMVQRRFLNLWEHPGNFFTFVPDVKSQTRLLLWQLKQLRGNAVRDEGVHRRSLRELALEEVSWCRPRVPSLEQQVLDREQVQKMLQLASERFPVIAQAMLHWSLMGYRAAEIAHMVHEQYGVSWTLLQTDTYRARVLGQVWSWFAGERVEA